jgi:hypothetical protein
MSPAAARDEWVIATADLWTGGPPGAIGSDRAFHAGDRLTRAMADREGWTDIRPETPPPPERPPPAASSKREGGQP